MNDNQGGKFHKSVDSYPRPQLEREPWISLNSPWDFAIDPESSWKDPESVTWNDVIVVPFSPETSASGIQNTGFFRSVWYRRSFERPELVSGNRLILHFGAVDYIATVWVNGTELCSHQGGYTPFKADITDVLGDSGAQEIVVRADDDPMDLAKPRGKQDWKRDPHSIWYPRTTGIWQTVWLEEVPPSHIETVRWTCDLERWEIGVEAHIGGRHSERLDLSVRLHVGDVLLSRDTYSVVSGEVHRQIALSDPGIDDYRNELLWSPSSPTIIDAELELLDAEGRVVDQVTSYTALRSIGVQGDRFVLNNRPLTLRLVLDQGYWPYSGSTAPNDDALLEDVRRQVPSNGAFFVLGESFSGPLALRIASENSERVAGLVLCNSFVSSPRNAALAMRRQTSVRRRQKPPENGRATDRRAAC